MSIETSPSSRSPGLVVVPPPDIESIRDNWGWFSVLGMIQILVGTAAIVMSVIATIATVQVIGLLALIAGGVQLASTIWARGWSGVLQHILCGVLYLVFGLIAVMKPLMTAEVMTLILAMLFLVGGLFRVGLAISGRFHQWGYVLLSGFITLILGILILAGWPETGLWVIGTFVGIELLITGWTWLMLSFALKGSMPKQTAAPAAV